MKIKLTAIFFSAFLLASCAHTPTKGDKMMTASSDAKILSKQWEQGSKLTSTGISQHNKGLAMISEGETQVTKGNKLIADGNKMSYDGEQHFEQGKQLQQESENTFDQQYRDTTQ